MSETNNKTPIVKVLHAIRPVQKEGKLTYPNLEKAVRKNILFDRAREQEFYGQDPNSPDEESAAKELAKSYFLQTVLRLSIAVNDDIEQLWADRMTKASLELYGEPNVDRAVEMLKLEYEHLLSISLPSSIEDDRQELLHMYKQFGILDTPEQQISTESLLFSESLDNTQEHVSSYINSSYSLVIEAFDELPNIKLTAKQTVDVFNSIINDLCNTHPELIGWKAQLVNDSDTIFTNDELKTIEIGANRASSHPILLKGVFLHEIIAHATRATRGAEMSPLLGKGLPNYLAFEEGIGALLEYCASGVIPAKISDRYTDVAIALGLNGARVNRSELERFAMLRAKIRKYIETGENLNHDDEAAVSTHINRIYRGSNGGNIVGVFTKDISYFIGFEKVVNYIDSQLKKGHTIQEVMDYILQGRFDPEDMAHVRYRSNNNLKDKL